MHKLCSKLASGSYHPALANPKPIPALIFLHIMATDTTKTQRKKLKALNKRLVDFREDWDALRWEFGLVPTPETRQYFNEKAEIQILILSDQIKSLLASQESGHASTVAVFVALKAKLERMICNAANIKQELEGSQTYVYKYTDTSKWKVIALPEDPFGDEEILERDQGEDAREADLDTIMEEAYDEAAVQETIPIHAKGPQASIPSRIASRTSTTSERSDARHTIQEIRNKQHLWANGAANTGDFAKGEDRVPQEEQEPQEKPQRVAKKDPAGDICDNDATSVNHTRTHGFEGRRPLASVRNGVLSIHYRNMSGIRHDTRAITKVFGEDNPLLPSPAATESFVVAAGTSTPNPARSTQQGAARSFNSPRTLLTTTDVLNPTSNRHGVIVSPRERPLEDIYEPSEQDDHEQEARRTKILQRKKPRLHTSISKPPTFSAVCLGTDATS